MLAKLFLLNKKKRNRTRYELKSEISVYICRDNEKYICECSSPDEELTDKDILIILKKILGDLSKKICRIEFANKDSYEVNLILYYYENIHNTNKFKYICVPRNVTKEKLAEYLFCFTCIYEYTTK